MHGEVVVCGLSGCMVCATCTSYDAGAVSVTVTVTVTSMLSDGASLLCDPIFVDSFAISK